MKENKYWYLLKASWGYTKERKKYVVFSYILFVCSFASHMFGPMLLGIFLNVLQTNQEDVLKDGLFWLLIYAIIPVVFWIFYGTGRLIERVTSFHTVLNYRKDIFENLTRIPLKWHKNHHSGNVMSRVEKSSHAMQEFTDYSYRYIETVIQFIISLAAIFYFSPFAGYMSILFGGIVGIYVFRANEKLAQLRKEMNTQTHASDATFYDYITNITTVITLRLEKLAQKSVVQKILSLFPIYKKYIVSNEAKWFLISMGLAGLNFLIIGQYIFSRVTTGQIILIGSLVALYQYTEKLTDVFFDISWKYEVLMSQYIDIKSVEMIFDEGKKVGKTKKFHAHKNWQKIDIQDLAFTYEDQRHTKHTLKNIDITIHRGEKIAFIGESGSGKSTLMSLIRGLDIPQQVHVRIDDVPQKSMQVLSDLISLIPQNPEIFENTIGYNIALGMKASKKELLRASELAQFTKILERLPHGLDTNIKEKGVNLSGGEKQRLALARGIFTAKQSSILLLDEPTSSVDPENELKIYKNIFSHFSDKSVISSIHRLHLLPYFDTIYVFHQGTLVGKGSFDELLSSNQQFKQIWSLYQQQHV